MNGKGIDIKLKYKIYKKLEKIAKIKNSTVDNEVDIILRKVLSEE